MKVNIPDTLFIGDVQQIASQFTSGGTTQLQSSPDFPQGMLPLVASLDDRRRPGPQFRRVPQRLFDDGAPLNRQRFIYVAHEFGIADGVLHRGNSFWLGGLVATSISPR